MRINTRFVFFKHRIFVLKYILLQLQLVEVDTKPRPLVVCFSRMFTFENWRLLLTALELYDFYGVDLSVTPIASVVDSIHTILKVSLIF
jgi:hypothetical protein